MHATFATVGERRLVGEFDFFWYESGDGGGSRQRTGSPPVGPVVSWHAHVSWEGGLGHAVTCRNDQAGPKAVGLLLRSTQMVYIEC